MTPSAGLLVWRRSVSGHEVLIVHPGGPFWARRDEGAWSLPKGELADPAEDPLSAARREFHEELGLPAPDGPAVPLGSVTQKAGKVVLAWAVEGDLDPAEAVSNTFEIEWPPRSGRRAEFPEVDRVAWCSLAEAAEKLNPAQVAFLGRLETLFDA